MKNVKKLKQILLYQGEVSAEAVSGLETSKHCEERGRCQGQLIQSVRVLSL